MVVGKSVGKPSDNIRNGFVISFGSAEKNPILALGHSKKPYIGFGLAEKALHLLWVSRKSPDLALGQPKKP